MGSKGMVSQVRAIRRVGATVLAGMVALGGAGCTTAEGPTGILAPGKWGGVHVVIVVSDSVAIAEFDCAIGRFPMPVQLNNGAFVASGTFTQGQGVEMIGGSGNPPKAARYSGRIAGDRMTVTVLLTEEQQNIGTFELLRGSNGQLFKCL